MEMVLIDTAHQSQINHMRYVLNDYRPILLNQKHFGGNYKSTHSEINLLFNLKLLKPKIEKFGYNKKSKNLPNKYKKKIPKIIYVIRCDKKGKLMYSSPCP
eukprot:111911_1